ncbi:Protein tpx2 [Linnemannia elongata]|nr:Protein tpx2 [Linnemannia elongata]
MDSPTSSRASSPQHSVLNSPSLRKHRDRAATSTYRPVQQPSFAPSTTPLKSPGVRYRQQQQQHQRHQQQEEEESELYNALHSTEHDDNLEQPRSAQVHATTSSLFKTPSYLSSKHTESESRPASAIHLQQANDMTKSIYKLLEDNARTKEGVSRQAQNSVSVANQSLEVFRQSQRRSSGTPTSASRNTSAATKVQQQQQPVSKPLLRTTETEYDVSPSRTARLMTSPPASSFVGTPSRRSHLRHQTPGSMRIASPTHRHSQDRQVEEKSRPEDAATLEWLKQTVDAEEFDHQRYTRRASTEVGEVPEQQEEHEDPYQTEDHHQETDPFDSATQRDDSYPHKRQSLGSPSKRRRSNEHVEDIYSQKENIPLETEAITPLDSYLSRSAHYPKTPEMDHSVTEAESSLLEVAETTTTITNQLRGVYTNLQDFFSPETEAKLQDAITVIGSQKAIRVAKGLSSSTTRPRPLEFRSASVRKDYRKPSSAPQSTRLLTTPQPFNFSERLNSIQFRRPSSSLSKSLGASSAAALRSSRAQELQRTMTNGPSTPIAQNRTVNEYQEMSKSPFIPLAQRKKQLEKSSLNDLPESTKRPLTIPKAPVLHTSSRSKTTAIPFEERVLQDIAQQGGYKANTVDKRVIESSGEYGVPKPVKSRLTVPKSPVLTKRRPAPMRPAVMPIRSDAQHQHSHQHQHQQQKTHKAGITERGLVSSAESARRLSQDRNRKPAHHLPPNKPSLTVPEPFSLATDARGQRYQEQFRNKLTKWRQIEKEHQFKALPLPTYPEVFVPKKSNRPLTHVEPVHLMTDRRAEEREAYEQERLRKEKLAQALLAEQAREDELREMRELRALRERLVPHPTPIKEYPRIEIHKSTRPLTTPRSPNIGQKRKRQMTLERDASHDQEEEEVERLHRSRHQRQQRQHLQEHRSHSQRDHDEGPGQYQDQHMEEEQRYVVNPQEEEELERERQRENERAQQQEYERRRLSSYSNSRGEGGGGGAVDRERQNRIREEIEQQREKDQGYLLEREERQLQAERQAYRRRSSQSRATVGGRREEYEDREEYGQDKRQRLGQTTATATTVGDAKYESQLFARKMGRKSWMAANDI